MESTWKKLGFPRSFALLAARVARSLPFARAEAGSGAPASTGDRGVVEPMADAPPDQAAGSGGGARTMARSWSETGSTSLA